MHAASAAASAAAGGRQKGKGGARRRASVHVRGVARSCQIALAALNASPATQTTLPWSGLWGGPASLWRGLTAALN